MRTIPLTIVMRSLGVGGTENHLLQLLPRLDPKRFDIELIPLGYENDMLHAFVDAGIVVSSANRNALGITSVILHLIRRVHARKPLLHTFLPEPYLLGAPIGLFSGAKALVMSRRGRNYYQRRHQLAAWIEHRLHRHMDILLGNSLQVVTDLLEEGAPPERVRLIYNGIDISKYVAGADHHKKRQITRTNLGIPESCIVVICVANLFNYKGHADLFKAIALLGRTFLDKGILLVVGRDEGAKQMLESLMASLGLSANIHFLGERSDISELLLASDIGILASHEEGFPNAVLEGMAASLPMVVTDVGGNAKAIIDGECGYVVPAHQPSMLALALSNLLNDITQRQMMGRLARKRVTELFSIETCVAAYESLYEEVWSRVKHH